MLHHTVLIVVPPCEPRYPHGIREAFHAAGRFAFVQLTEFACRKYLRNVQVAAMSLDLLEGELARSLNALPTSFSRLAFLTSLRDPYTGRYLHEGWLFCSSADEIHEILRKTHEEVFELVLNVTMPLLCGELRSYLDSFSESRERTMRFWLELESYRDMIPERVCVEAREFFLSQMRTSLNVLLTVPDWPQILVLSS